MNAIAAQDNAVFQQITTFQQPRHSVGGSEPRVSPVVFASYRYRVPTLDSCWIRELQSRLNELTSLPVGWDGYAGRPVSFQCANFVANMLERLCQDNVPAPCLVPGSDGSLQVEWHRNFFDVELDILGVQNVVATRVNLRTNEEEVIEIQSDFSEIVNWISALAKDENILEQENA